MLGAGGRNEVSAYGQNGRLLLYDNDAHSGWREQVYLGDRLVAQRRSSGGVRTFYLTDALGSPRVASSAYGAVLWRENYRPWGQRNTKSADMQTDPLAYTAQPFDDETSLLYLGARYHHVKIGRFYQMDPVHFTEDNSHSFNRFAYANNNPDKFVDPNGDNALTAVGGLLQEGYNFAVGNDYDFGNVWGALKDGYNGEGDGFWGAAGEDALTFGGGVIGAIAKFGRFGKALQFGNDVPKSTVQANKAAGDAFEQQVMGQLQQTQSGVVQQVTVRTQSGVKTRIDLMGRDAKGNIVCTECKASATAPLTKNQAAAFPEIQQSGAVVIGKGKPGFPGGTEIPPTTVNIIRP